MEPDSETPLSEVAAASERVRAERGRNAKIGMLAELFARARTEAATLAAWLVGELPQGRIGLGWATLGKAAEGLGPVETSTLTVAEVDRVFGALARLGGPGSGAERQALLRELLGRAGEVERRFLMHLVMGEMRQGALDGVVLAAVAKAYGAGEAAVRRAVMLAGSLPEVARRLAAEGPDALATIGLATFVPVLPMLADTAEDLESLAPDLGALLFEVKLDGARVQAHVRRGEVRVFSRALNEVTAAVPEVVAQLSRLDDAILDGEVIALRKDGRPHPFQTTMRRFGRKIEDLGVRAELPLTPFWFDLLHEGGVDLVDRPLAERRARLEALVPGHLTEAARPATPEEAAAFFSAALAKGHEGILAKRLDSAYSAGQRGAAWRKLKPAKTLDLVVIAVEVGSGRRSRWLSNLHLAARDETPEGDVRWVMLGKTFKGMSDELLEWQTRELAAREVRREGHVVHVRPELVVEIAFQELEASPRYPGGVALRFARVMVYRPDKRPEDADTLATVRELFAARGGSHKDGSPV
jgi:DNA ligase-1